LVTMRIARSWIATHPVVSFLVVFAVFPYLVPYKALATQVLIYGLFALGFNLLYGYTGLLSFGHAAYWGLGAYGTGIALAKLKVGSLWLGLAAGLGLAAAGGAGIGFFCLRRRGIYFAMLTLSFAQLLYFVGFHLADWTGRDAGLGAGRHHDIARLRLHLLRPLRRRRDVPRPRGPPRGLHRVLAARGRGDLHGLRPLPSERHLGHAARAARTLSGRCAASSPCGS